MQWKVAAAFFVTFPLAVWASFYLDGRARQIMVFVGCLPLFFGGAIEIMSFWRRTLREPHFRYEGSSIGNKIAVALGLLFLALLAMLAIQRMAHGA